MSFETQFQDSRCNKKNAWMNASLMMSNKKLTGGKIYYCFFCSCITVASRKMDLSTIRQKDESQNGCYKKT